MAIRKTGVAAGRTGQAPNAFLALPYVVQTGRRKVGCFSYRGWAALMAFSCSITRVALGMAAGAAVGRAKAPSRATTRARRQAGMAPVSPAWPDRSSASGERGELAGEADRVVVGDEESRPPEDPQLGGGQQVERLLGDAQGVEAVLVGPQQQHGKVDPPVALQQVAAGVAGPAAGEARPRAGEVRVAADVGERVAHQVARGRVAPRRQVHPRV